MSTACFTRVECFLQGQPLLDAATMTTKTLASEYLTVKGSMWSSKSMLQIIRSKALANIAVSTTDSDYPSTSNSSPKGKLSSQQSIIYTHIYIHIYI